MSEKKPGPDPTIPRIARRRACLMCRHAFASAWSGERVCTKCKGSRDWRMGDAAMDGEHGSGGGAKAEVSVVAGGGGANR